MKTIELIVPCYNEEKCIRLFYDKIKEVFDTLDGFDFLITYIDDGSRDGTVREVKNIISEIDSERVQYISLSRNFGKESAIYAGLSKSTGDYVAVMDADLQHPPELLSEMIAAIETEGYDCASARRVNRKGEPVFRSLLSKGFYHVINHVTVIDLVPGSTDYRLMKHSVAEAIASMSETERFTKGIYAWVGFKNKWIEYENVERAAGHTKWSVRGLFRYALNGFLAFATTPLRCVIYFGLLVVFISAVLAVRFYIGALNSSNTGNGFATLAILMLFLGGVIITILGVIGEYIARIYMEVKNRPIYFARDEHMVQQGTQEHEKDV